MAVDCVCIFGCSPPLKFGRRCNSLWDPGRDMFINGKGTGQISGYLWLLQVFSRIVIVSLSLYFNIFLPSFLGFLLAGICH